MTCVEHERKHESAPVTFEEAGSQRPSGQGSMAAMVER